MKNKPQLHFAKPADRSLQAFKDWINALADKLVPGLPDDISEEEWISKHKKFWEGVDRGLAEKQANNKQKPS